MHDGAGGLFRDAPRGRAFAAASPERIAAVVERTLREVPPAATPWTLRSMAKASGLAPSTIHGIWREHGLKPHRGETFKLPNGPKFVEKVRDIVGLYPTRSCPYQRFAGILAADNACLGGRGWLCLQRAALSSAISCRPHTAGSVRQRGGKCWWA
jgi:hypothetical protein